MATNFHKLEVHSPGPTAQGTKVLLDGEELRGVRALQINWGYKGLILVTAEFIAQEADVAIEAEGCITETTDIQETTRTFALSVEKK